MQTGHISYPAKCASACVNKMRAVSSSVRGFKSVQAYPLSFGLACDSQEKSLTRFHFGYPRVETLSSIVAALFMATKGGITLHESYREFLSPTAVLDPLLALVVASAATLVSSLLLIYKRRAAEKYGSLALKTDASNSIKDVLTSITAFVGIALSSYFNLPQTDAIAGIIISLFVFTMVYPILKEASLVLLDSYHSPETIQAIENIAKSITPVKKVHSIRMRKLGSYLIGDMHVVLSNDITVEEAYAIASQIEDRSIKEFDEIIEMNVIIEPYETKNKGSNESLGINSTFK